MKGNQKIPTLKFITLFLSIIFVLNTNIPGANVQLDEKIEFSMESKLPVVPRAFCVTEDELYIIPDQQAGDIKIYERDGTFLKLVKTIGQKGFDKDELAEPTYCFYNRVESKFGVFDIRLKKIIIYDRIDRKEFIRVHEFYCLRGATGIKLSGDRLFISGYKADQNQKPYHLYNINFTNNQTTFLLPSHIKFGLKSLQEFETISRSKPDIKVIGKNGWFDVLGDDVYSVWEGNLKINKISIDSGKIISFGKKTSRYIKPYASPGLTDARRRRNTAAIRSEWAKMSYIRNIFAGSKFVLLIYEGPIEQQGRDSSFWLQFYTLDGNFVKEVPIPGQPNYKMWYDNDGDILYSLSNKPDNELYYFILKYKILE